MREPFHFKQFSLTDGRSAMKLSTDAVLLGAFADVRNAREILDIGTGSGVIALMLAQRSNARITGIDADEGSVEDARENFSASPWHDRLEAVHQPLQEYVSGTNRKFDVIVSNPPYFRNSHRSPIASRNISKHAELLTFPLLLKAAHSLLDEKGSSSFIIPAAEFAEFDRLAQENGLHLQRIKWIQPKRSKAANRVLLDFGVVPTNNPVESSISIRLEDNSFTGEYMDFTRDFYLNF